MADSHADRKARQQIDNLSAYRDELRSRAQKLINPFDKKNYAELSQSKAARLLHQLETHQIELEMQIRELFDTQDELRKAQAEYEDLYQSAPVGYLTTGQQGEIEKANATFAEFLGCGEAEPRPKSITDYIHFDDQDVYYRHCQDLLNTHKQQSCELRLKTTSGQTNWVRLDSNSVVKPEAGDKIQIRSVVTDINKHKKFEAALEIVSKEAELANSGKSDFLAKMSHEIRTPMNGISGVSALLLDTELDQQQRNYVEIIHESAEALTTIINDIQDFSRLEARQIRLKKSDFHLDDLLESVISIIQPHIAPKELEIIRDFSPVVQHLYQGDSGRLRQILVNLLSNAVKFTESGYITIRVVDNDTHSAIKVIRFEIRDTGLGISSKDMDSLFDSYMQVATSAADPRTGTGLGLAICKGLVNTMQGRIGVESEPGQGSLFWFELPLVQLSEERLPDQGQLDVEVGEVEQDEICEVSLNVLVVDDEAISQLVAHGLIETFGHHVEVVKNGIEAIEAVKKNIYDVIFMDMEMPEMNGLQATRAIREIGGSVGNIPVIGLSANVMIEKQIECEQAGMNDFMTKPLDKNKIKELLNKYLIKSK